MTIEINALYEFYKLRGGLKFINNHLALYNIFTDKDYLHNFQLDTKLQITDHCECN